MLFVGEQPGDQEDRQGRPFVGPAGRVLERAMQRANIERTEVYVTNAVKHFKWTPRGKRRIHDKPNRSEIVACKPWLTAELAAIDPDVVVLLGATAVDALLGRQVQVQRDRGQDLRDTGIAGHVIVTAHPSSILRLPDARIRDAAEADLVRDLEMAKAIADGQLS